MRQQFKCLSCSGVYLDASTEGGTYHHACPLLPPDATDKQRKAYHPRNENLAPAGPGRAAEIIAEGEGVKCLSNPKLTEPAWITSLKHAAAKASKQP